MSEMKRVKKWNLKLDGRMVSVIIFLTWLIIMPIIIFLEFSQFSAWIVLALFGLVILGMVAAFLYFSSKSAWKHLSYDERTERFQMKASRNGFVMAALLTTVLAATASIRGSQIDTLSLLLWIWMWVVGTYMLSLVFYINAE
jgi:hypothetical protein